MMQIFRAIGTSLGSVTLASTGVAAGRAAGYVAVSSASVLVGGTTLHFIKRGLIALGDACKGGVDDLDQHLNNPAFTAKPERPSKVKKGEIDPVELEIARRIQAGILRVVTPAETATAAAAE